MCRGFTLEIAQGKLNLLTVGGGICIDNFNITITPYELRGIKGRRKLSVQGNVYFYDSFLQVNILKLFISNSSAVKHVW